jgi:hypothetical protein
MFHHAATLRRELGRFLDCRSQDSKRAEKCAQTRSL